MVTHNLKEGSYFLHSWLGCLESQLGIVMWLCYCPRDVFWQAAEFEISIRWQQQMWFTADWSALAVSESQYLKSRFFPPLARSNVNDRHDRLDETYSL